MNHKILRKCTVSAHINPRACGSRQKRMKAGHVPANLLAIYSPRRLFLNRPVLFFKQTGQLRLAGGTSAHDD